MKTLLLLAAVAAVGLANDDSCPNFTPWGEHSSCLWFPLNSMRKEFIAACDLKVTGELPDLPKIGNMPEKCGHCSFKARCRKRARQDGCFPLDMDHEVCHEHGDICEMPKFPKYNLGCRYEFASLYLRQCANRADFDTWKSDGMRKMASMLPNFHCQPKGDGCACCCHPYVPNADGTACEKHEEPKCKPWTDWNDFSDKCVWFPPLEMRKTYQEHCGIDVPVSDKAMKVYEKFATLPNGEAFPDKCGFCSYKIKCRKRDKMSEAGKKECFPLEVEKKACGPDDCEGCGEICSLPKMPEAMGVCNFTETLHKIAGKNHGSKYKKLPMNMKMGLTKLAALLPHGKCVEKGDQCKCCCHPYVPNADGTACEVRRLCMSSEDENSGIDVDLNLPEPSFFWF